MNKELSPKEKERKLKATLEKYQNSIESKGISDEERTLFQMALLYIKRKLNKLTK